MKDILEFVARYLVDNPDEVKVESLEGQRAIILQLSVAPEDMGKIIGRNGRVAKALRTLVGAAAVRDGRSAIVEIVQ
ncbi:MAG TPA: KH domain-containing protein [Actinomycetota bacterium]|nr:KH domain-containing protein [Actinomycetota bacterium]